MTKYNPAYFSIGLTGGIGCGKTTVSDLFAARGAGIIDTDLIAHSLTTAQGAAMPALLAAFGADCATPDGALDRAKMRALVFSDTQAKARLEAILHPRILAATEEAALRTQGSYLIYVVPLLVESGRWQQRVDRVLVIDCPEALQIERVGARSGLTRQQVQAIMATQATRAARLAAADDIILNDDGLAALLPQIERLHQTYLACSKVEKRVLF